MDPGTTYRFVEVAGFEGDVEIRERLVLTENL
jgi:hypothetical protein